LITGATHALPQRFVPRHFVRPRAVVAPYALAHTAELELERSAAQIHRRNLQKSLDNLAQGVPVADWQYDTTAAASSKSLNADVRRVK
jgi:hypothetical protein